MKSKVYVETSVIGYLTSKLSRDLITAAKQQYTTEWWSDKRLSYDLFISQLVIKEISLGNSELAKERLAFMTDIPVLSLQGDIEQLASGLIQNNYLPQRASTDALHIAIVATQKMDFLLTWNCKHIANANMRPKIERFLISNGYKCPVICTPEELEGG